MSNLSTKFHENQAQAKKKISLAEVMILVSVLIRRWSYTDLPHSAKSHYISGLLTGKNNQEREETWWNLPLHHYSSLTQITRLNTIDWGWHSELQHTTALSAADINRTACYFQKDTLVVQHHINVSQLNGSDGGTALIQTGYSNVRVSIRPNHTVLQVQLILITRHRELWANTGQTHIISKRGKALRLLEITQRRLLFMCTLTVNK